MADGELTVKLTDDTMRRLQVEADAAGQSMGDYVARVLTERFDDNVEGYGVEEDLRRLKEYDRTGEYVSVEEAMTFFRDEVEKRLALRK